jgi:hypothetical protein
MLVLTCQDPTGYEPDDPYVPAPDPPEIIYPVADTSFNAAIGVPIMVLFDWTAVSGAEAYEIQHDTALAFPNDTSQTVQTAPVYIAFYRYEYITTHYCRIRALSATWEDGFTEWSETRKFYIKPDP